MLCRITRRELVQICCLRQMLTYCKRNQLDSGADPGFPVGGGANSAGRGRQHMILSNFPKNLHEIENILGRRWRGTCRGAPLDLPLRFVNFLYKLAALDPGFAGSANPTPTPKFKNCMKIKIETEVRGNSRQNVIM